MDTQKRKWLALACLSLAQFMLVVDDTVVNVALPTIQQELGFSQRALVWVVNGYILPFGGLLLLGGRLADLLGRRRLFLVGSTLFLLASALNGLAWSASMLVAMRVLQGVGAALVAPAGLALVAVLFENEVDRTKALGVWGGLSALGLTVGVLLSGVLTDLLSWRWVFYINVPLGLLSLVGVRMLVSESFRPTTSKRIDVLGGLTVTGGVTLLLLFLMEAEPQGVANVLWILGASVLLLVAFVVTERRVESPLIPIELLVRRDVIMANGLAFLIPAAFFGMFFLLTLHMQRVLDYSPIQAGLAYLGFAFSVIAGIGVCTKLILRFGARVLLTLGMLLSAGGLLVFSRLSLDGSYAAEILPGMMLLGVGGGWSLVTVTVFALGNLERSEAGLASGLLNASQQLGGALGLGVLVTLAQSRASQVAATADVAPSPEALQLAGSSLAFMVAAGISTVGAVLAAGFVPAGLKKNVDPTLAAAPDA